MEAKFYDPETLRRLQQEILSILDDFLLICRENGLEYYGIAGTAIGAIRHKGFIPWDDDIDIAMPRRDFERFCRIVKCAERQYLKAADTELIAFLNDFGKLAVFKSVSRAVGSVDVDTVTEKRRSGLRVIFMLVRNKAAHNV